VAYRADIEIGVRGARDLEQLRSAINQTAKAVDSLNEVVGQRGRLVQSIQNYTNNLDRAAQSLRKVGAGTEAETKAVREYVQILGQATTARERQNNLIEEQIRLQQTAARTAKLAASGIRENPNQYAGPIGPGPASPVALSSKLYGRLEQAIGAQVTSLTSAAKQLNLKSSWNTFFEEAAQVATELKQTTAAKNLNLKSSWNTFFEEAAQVAVEIKAAAQRTSAEIRASEGAASATARERLAATAAERRAGVSGVVMRPIAGAAYATPAGPGGSGVTSASAVAASAAIERQVAQTRRTQAQAELKIVKDRGIAENYITGVINRRLAAKAKELELERQQTVEVERRAASERRQRNENVALGAGFPLLFGAGPGAVIGGALGGLIPGNPMLSVVTSAIGAQLDAAIAKISEIGIGLRQLDFNRLEESGLRVSQILKEQVQLLINLGQTSQAYQVLQQEAARITGTLPGTITDISNATGILNSAWSEFTNVASTTLGIVGAPFAAALGGLVKLVSELLKGVNNVVSLFAEGLKTVGEWSVRLVAGEEGLKRVKDLIDSINRSIGQGNAEFVQSNLIPLNEEIVLNRQILDVQKQRTTETTLSGKIQNSNITYTIQTLKNEQKYTESIVELNQKKNSISKELYQQNLRQLQVIRNQSDEYAKQARDLEIQQARRQEQEEQARKRKQAIEEALKEEQRFRQSILNLSKEENDYLTSSLDTYADYLKVSKGVEVSIQHQLDTFSSYADARLASLKYERFAAVEAAKTVQEEEKLINIYNRKQEILRNQLVIQRTMLRAQQMQAVYEAADAQGILSADKQRGFEKTFTRFQPDVSTAFGSALNLASADKGVQQLETYQKELDTLTEKTAMAKQGAEGIGTAFSGAFQSLVTGTQTAQEALAGFFNGVAEAFMNMATEIIAKMITMYAFKTLLGLFGGGGGSLFSGQGPVTLPAAGVGGGASTFMPGAVNFRANGGPVTGGSPYIVGERGPELFVPGRSGSIVPNNQLPGGGDTIVNGGINITVENTGESLGAEAQKQIARQVQGIVMGTLMNERRSGGLLR